MHIRGSQTCDCGARMVLSADVEETQRSLSKAAHTHIA